MQKFFWNSGSHVHKLIFFNWDKVCRSKAEGGFNIKETISSNKALISKQIVKIHNHSGIWATWVHAYCIKNSEIWCLSIHHTDSWAWHGLLKVHDYLISITGSREDSHVTLNSQCNMMN